MPISTILDKKINIMVVDDSLVMRKMYQRSFQDNVLGIEILLEAENGLDAIQKLETFYKNGNSINIVLLDLEMPKMGGFEAINHIKKIDPNIKIIIISSISISNADISIHCLEKGANDFLAKPQLLNSPNAKNLFIQTLYLKILVFSDVNDAENIVKNIFSNQTSQDIKNSIIADSKIFNINKSLPKYIHVEKVITKPKAIAIGSSTGGPQALFDIFENIKDKIKLDIPIFITQHMPPNFTIIFASQIMSRSGFNCIEAKNNMIVESGCIYVAPGNFHMIIEYKSLNENIIRLTESEPEHFCRPSVNPMLRSLASLYKKDLLTIILTGMGSDGIEGAHEVIKYDGSLIAQDKESSVVWGMPKAIADAGICNKILSLQEIINLLIELLGVQNE